MNTKKLELASKFTDTSSKCPSPDHYQVETLFGHWRKNATSSPYDYKHVELLIKQIIDNFCLIHKPDNNNIYYFDYIK